MKIYLVRKFSIFSASTVSLTKFILEGNLNKRFTVWSLLLTAEAWLTIVIPYHAQDYLRTRLLQYDVKYVFADSFQSVRLRHTSIHQPVTTDDL